MKKLLLFGVLSSLCFNMFAQKKVDWTMSAGGAIPISSFGKINYDASNSTSDCGLFDKAKNGGATTGLNIGFEMMIPVAVNGLNFTVSADLFYNGVKQETKTVMNDFCILLKDMVNQQAIEQGLTVVSSSVNVDKNAYYLNVPLMVGFNYSYPFNNEMKLFASAGMGLNFRYISAWKIVLNYTVLEDYSQWSISETETFSYDNAISLAFRLGCGINLTKHISLSAWYYNLGKGDVSVQIKTEKSNSAQNTTLESITPSLFVIKCGYNF